MVLLKAILAQVEPEEVGDGKAKFLSDMTEEEYEDYQRNEVQGWGKVLKKLGIK